MAIDGVNDRQTMAKLGEEMSPRESGDVFAALTPPCLTFFMFFRRKYQLKDIVGHSSVSRYFILNHITEIP
jgi:hypothetical protein